jgi:asparagine synthase (glutamine-hydrolysing)
MCGLTGGFGEPSDAAVAALAHRGPDARAVVRSGAAWLGHTRLAVMDLDPRSDQPFRRGPLTLAYNGEAWNYAHVREHLESLGEVFTTSGDTEVVAAALLRWPAEEALRNLDFMGAMAWTVEGEGVLRLARDRFGEVPLHASLARPFRFASELKALVAAGADPRSFRDVGPGELWEVSECRVERVTRWYDPPCAPDPSATRAVAALDVKQLVLRGASRRAMSDAPACTLLSGGIDSAAVALTLVGLMPGLTAFVAVMDECSPDLRCAREVAEALRLPLVEVKVRPPTADDLARVVRAIEMPYKAQVEIGWPCLALAEAIRAEGFKVTFSGEGSDELWASYGFSYHALETQDWHQYRKDLFLSQARKNFPRANKAFMAHSVECRLPFLHYPLVERALALPREAVQDRGRPKAVIQDAFRGLLPDSVTRRQKLAFQDGLGLKPEVSKVLPDPRRFYAAEFERAYG